jgi:hypothetical protein
MGAAKRRWGVHCLRHCIDFWRPGHVRPLTIIEKYGDDLFRDSEDKPVPEKEQKKSYFELFDVSKKSVIATVPLDQIKHMPRTGERIFLPLHEPGDWVAFKILDIEYFLRTKEGPLDDPGMLRVTVYVEESK